ncbi:putative FHA domain-containing protein [Gammaproteobacteria bacterium]
MTDYVRICPRCGHVSPEYDNVCGMCQHFIGMEEAVPPPPRATATPVTPAAAPQPPTVPPPPLAQRTVTPTDLAREPLTQRFVSSDPTLFLEVGNGTLLPMRSGWRLGQAHASNDAEVQLPAQTAGVEFVHRHHCRFDHERTQWYVTALDQRLLGRDFTNRTQINGRLLPPGERRTLSDGDELRLSGVILRIRIPPNTKWG